MITVVGGTGRLGTHLVTALLARGSAVRVVSRNARSSQAPARPAEAEYVDADVADAAQARSAIAGSTHVVAAITGMDPRRGAGPRAVDRDATMVLTDAAAVLGAHLVLVSVVGAAPDSPIELFRMKWAAEAHLRASDLQWTIVRATAFAELWSDIITSSVGHDGRARLFGPARNPMNFVPVGDVAAAVVHAIEDETLVGRSIEVRGRENLSLTALATQLTGHEPRHLPTPAVRALGRVAQPFAPGLARVARQALDMEHVDLVTTT